MLAKTSPPEICLSSPIGLMITFMKEFIGQHIACQNFPALLGARKLTTEEVLAMIDFQAGFHRLQ